MKNNEKLQHTYDGFDLATKYPVFFSTEQCKDPWIQIIITFIEQPNSLLSKILQKQVQCFSLLEGIFYWHNFLSSGNHWILVVPAHMRANPLLDFYDEPTDGHIRFSKTYARLKKRFYWPQLLWSCPKIRKSLLITQKKKRHTSCQVGLLQPLVCLNLSLERFGKVYVHR